MTGVMLEDLTVDTFPPGTELSIPGVGKVMITGLLQPSKWSEDALIYPIEFANNGHPSHMAASFVIERMAMQR